MIEDCNQNGNYHNWDLSHTTMKTKQDIYVCKKCERKLAMPLGAYPQQVCLEDGRIVICEVR